MIKIASSALLLALMTTIFALLYSSANFSEQTPAPNLSDIDDIWNTLYYILEAVIFFWFTVDKLISEKDKTWKAAWFHMSIFTFVRLLWEFKAAFDGRPVGEKEVMLVFAWVNVAMLITIPISPKVTKFYIRVLNYFRKTINLISNYIKKNTKNATA